jgi:hypothetical protein
MARPYRTKMLWYYSAIIDWMIANPGRPLSECAAHIQRTPSTLSIIINSDMFKAALAQRKAEFQMHHDVGLIQKTAQVANASLDALLLALDKKKDAVPLDTLREISNDALTRLGYGTQKSSPGMTVQVNGGNATIFTAVSEQDLQEARMALRQVQHNNSQIPQQPAMKTIEHDPLDALLQPPKEAGPVDEVEDADASASVAT